jgi:uncharacterized membrane protein YkvA (DUF1232 family)
MPQRTGRFAGRPVEISEVGWCHPLRGVNSTLIPGIEPAQKPVSKEAHVSVEDVQAVIASAKARGEEHLERYVRNRLPDATDDQVAETVEVALEVIESIPVLLARAAQKSREKNLEGTVGPILNHAELYFLRPVDLIPEMTHGLAGLLDDTYLVLRVFQNLQKGPEPFLDWELDEPLAFLRTLLGKRIGEKLDSISVAAMHEVSQHVSSLWQQISREA